MPQFILSFLQSTLGTFVSTIEVFEQFPKVTLLSCKLSANEPIMNLRYWVFILRSSKSTETTVRDFPCKIRSRQWAENNPKNFFLHSSYILCYLDSYSNCWCAIFFIQQLLWNSSLVSNNNKEEVKRYFRREVNISHAIYANFPIGSW